MTMAEETEPEKSESVTQKDYQDLCLDLNLDKATADDAWNIYEAIQQSYTLEGDQLPWLACSLYTSCRKRSVPTVGGRPGNVIQGNCVSLTRMLQHCNLPLTDFISKMKSWLAMCHCDEDFCKRVDLLERNFAVCSNIFKTYKPIFLDLFQNPDNDQPRVPRSRKQRRPPCNATELFNFCWTLYIFIKGKYPSIPQDLVSCYSLLLACIDLMYTNVVLSNRLDLLNPECKGLPEGLLDCDNREDLSSWPVSIMDYLCKKFEGVVVDTKVVRDYYWKANIEDLVKHGLLKGTSEGTGLVDQANFDHNVKEIKNAYEEYLLSCGEFDERMFLNDALVIKGSSRVSSPSQLQQQVQTQSLPFNITNSSGLRSARCNLSQTFEGDHHLIPQTPITGRRYTCNRPKVGSTPLTVITTGLQKLYALISGRKNTPGDKLTAIFRSLKNNPEEKIVNLVGEMSENFTRLYSKATEDYTAPSPAFTEMRLQMGQILFYTFLEHILMDEKKRNIDLEAILKEELFHRTLFTCCLEIVLKSYNDARRFPWSLQVGNVDSYYFMRIVEPVIRSEKESDNQLSRELVKHLKGIEEQILDSLAWRSESPLWQIIKDTGSEGIPKCEDVNFAHQLETGMDITAQTPFQQVSSIMSPAVKLFKDVPQSPLSSLADRMDSPNGQGTARRMLFPSASSTGLLPPTDVLKRVLPQGLTLPAGGRNMKASASPAGGVGAAADGGADKGQPSVKECVDSFLQSAQSPTEPPAGAPKPEDVKKDKPRRHGSLALFFRKFYTLANMRLRDLCDRLDILLPEHRQKIWTCFEYSILHYTDLMKDRHMDQMIMCAVYITCKVMGADRIFQEIMKHYRNQPQAASHVYRSVLISKGAATTEASGDSKADAAEGAANESTDAVKEGKAPATSSQGRGASASLGAGERGDLIKFYNKVYVQWMRNYALKFRATQEQEKPKLSPLPLNRITPVSPRRRISVNHSVFVNALNAPSPLKGGAPPISPKRPLPYFFNRSPAKDLRVINNMVRMQGGGKRMLLSSSDADLKPPRIEGFSSVGSGLSKRFQGVIGERQSPIVFEPSAPANQGGAHPDTQNENNLNGDNTNNNIGNDT